MCIDENYSKLKVFKNEIMNQTKLAMQLSQRSKMFDLSPQKEGI